MQQQAIEVASDAMEKYSVEKDIAQYIKKEFDSRAGATWHCIVGRNFGSFVTHGTSLLAAHSHTFSATSRRLISATRRNKALYLLLPRPLRYSSFQDAISIIRHNNEATRRSLGPGKSVMSPATASA